MHIISHEAHLREHLSVRTLVITRDELLSSLMPIFYEHGFSFVIPFSFYARYALQLAEIELIWPQDLAAQIGLAFFSPRWQKLYQALFEIYNLPVAILDSLSALEEKNYDVILWDQDLSHPAARHGRLHEFLVSLRQIAFSNRRFSLCLVKDFSQANSMHDLLTPLKEFCRTLLSPVEMYLLLRDYLYDYYRFACLRKLALSLDYYEKHGAFSLPLRHIPKLLEHLEHNLNKKAQDREKSFYEGYGRNRLIYALTSYMAQFLKQSEEEKALFIFMEKDSSRLP